MADPGQEPGITAGTGPARILSRDAFFHLLDLEVKRSRRYQNFFCVLVLKLAELHPHGNSRELGSCIQRLAQLLREEMRDSDILGALEETRLAVLLPYADLLAGEDTRSRFENSLRYYDFSRDGYYVEIEQLCFPRDGTDTPDLIEKMVGTNSNKHRQERI
jgi:GGDEF domain-containing protein